MRSKSADGLHARLPRRNHSKKVWKKSSRTKNRDSSNGHSRETNYRKNHAKEEFDKLTFFAFVTSSQFVH